MRIGIDARLINGKRRGMGNVLYNILLHLQNHTNSEVILYFDREIEKPLKNILKKMNYQIRIIQGTNYFIWEQILLPRVVKRDQIDVFWHPYNTGSIKLDSIQIVSIHDVMYMKSRKVLPYSKNLYQIMGRIYRKFNTPIIASRSKQIITISKHAKDDINTEIKGIKDKIKIVYNGCDKSLERDRDFRIWKEFKNQYGIGNEYFLCLGAVEPRKNTIYTIEVFSQFVKKNNLNTQLVICGLKDWKNSEALNRVKELGIEENVIFLDYVSDEILEILYIHAYIFLFLSYYEGFGLPIVEAMALKTPVITTGVTSMPEIAGNAAIITSHNNVIQTLEDIETLYFNKELYNELQEKGKERSKEFTWEIAAKNVAQIIKSTYKKYIERN